MSGQDVYLQGGLGLGSLESEDGHGKVIELEKLAKSHGIL